MPTERSLRDVLEPSVAEAEGQWKLMLDRQPTEPGERQTVFTAVEVVLCHAAAQLVEHRKFGSSTAQGAPEPVQLLATLFRRPPSSILAKMANLDGSRPHGAKFDRAAGIVWTADRDTFGRSYAATILAARRCGIDPATLPDFLAPGWSA